jgi:hypothetical protein
MVKIWRVEFGCNFSSHDVVAQTAREAIEKAEKIFLKEAVEDRKDWIESEKTVKDAPPPATQLLRLEPVTSVELIVEASTK